MTSAFTRSLMKLMDEHDDIITITADMGYSVFENIQTKFPKRFFNTGVTEQASASFAAGMALSGYKVFFYAQAAFATMRCFEQVRLDVAYNHTNVKIIGTNAGFSLNQLGASHFSVEDIGLMRLLPQFTIFTPGDPKEMEWAMKEAYKIDGPVYIRFTKLGSKTFHPRSFTNKIGNIIILAKGIDATLFISGGLLEMGMEVRGELKKKGIDLSVVSVPTIKPINSEMVLKEIRRTKTVFTLEEHSVIGGLGTTIAEIIAEANLNIHFTKIGFPDKYTSVTGSIAFLLDYNGISVDKIVKVILKKIKYS